MVNIGVTGVGSLIGQAIIKSIKNGPLSNKIQIIGFDYFNNTVGSFWCKSTYILPDILKKGVTEREWLDLLINKLTENNIELLFIGVDFELPLFAKYKQEIELKTGALVLVSSQEVISIANDKYLTYEFLKNNKLPHPASFLPENVDPLTLEYPVIVKPRKGARSIGVSKVHNAGDLQKAITSVKGLIIQECIGTDQAEFTCGTIFLDGELKRMIILNRSLKEGNTCISHFRKDYPVVIAEYLEAVCNILKPFGACNYQLRLDKEGVPKIFEINARHSGTTYIRSLFGYKEVEYIINSLLFNNDQQFELKEGTVVRFYDEFFVRNASK